MRYLQKALALAAFSAAVMAAPAAVADAIDPNHFQAMCDTNKDGMVSKAEAMKALEKMFDKHDTKKRGMLDKAQFELFLRELMKSGG